MQGGGLDALAGRRRGMKDGGNPAPRHPQAVRQEINATAKGLADKLRDAAMPKGA